MIQQIVSYNIHLRDEMFGMSGVSDKVKPRAPDKILTRPVTDWLGTLNTEIQFMERPLAS